MLKDTDKLGCILASILINRKCKLNIQDGEPLKDINQFQRFIETLIYLTVTRPNIFSVSQISKLMHVPRHHIQKQLIEF